MAPRRRFAAALQSLALACALAPVAGCNRSGQTGSPNEQPPSYETPSRFSPRDPSGGTGSDNPGGPGFGSNRPAYYPHGGDLMALLPSGHAVTAVNDRGVLVFDVSKPDAPKVVGELPLRGTFLQLNDDGDDAAPSITVAVIEDLSIDEPSVPEQPVASSALRLVHIDLTDPTAPMRTAQIDLEDDVWEFVRRDHHYVVLSELYEPAQQLCGQPIFEGESGPGTRAMRISDYELGDDGFTLRGSLELPADSSFAFATQDAYFVPTGFHADPKAPAMSWADFASGTLIERGSVPLDGRLLAIAREGGVLVALVERNNGPSSLQTFELDAQGDATARGSLALGSVQDRLELLPGAQRLLVGGTVGQLVDLSDLAQPRVVQQFPADAQRLFTVPQGVLALGGSSTGHLVASLWALPEPGSPQMLGRFVSPWPWANVVDSGYQPYRVDGEHGLLLAPITLGNPEIGPKLGVAQFDAGGVSFYGEYALHQDAFLPLDDGATAYSRGEQGLEVVPLEQGAMQTEPTSGYVPFYPPRVLSSVTIAGRELSLHERAEDGRSVVDVTGGNAPTTIVLEHRGNGLIAVGDRAVVLGARWDSECMFLSDPARNTPPDPSLFPRDPNTPFDACAPYRARGLSVIDLQGEPKVVASFAITPDMDFTAIDGVTAESEWSGYVQLPDGRLAFPVQRWLRCESQESCDALGTPAYQSMGSPGCNTRTQSCAELPAVEIFTSGAKASLLLYVLDDVAGEPRLTLAAEVEGRFTLPGEGPLDVGWQLLRDESGIAFAREEPIYDANGNSVQNAHEDPVVKFFLDRIAIDADGSLHALPSVNTPGRPVAWRGEELYSVEPAYDAEGEVVVSLHRSLLRDDAARIAESVTLGAGFLDAREVGDRLVVLRGPADPCADDPRTDLFMVALEPEAMSKSAAIDLPGRFWGFPYGPAVDADEHVLVRGGPLPGDGHLEVDVADPAHPSVVRYTNDPLRDY